MPEWVDVANLRGQGIGKQIRGRITLEKQIARHKPCLELMRASNIVYLTIDSK
jgi:hypothetical protein